MIAVVSRAPATMSLSLWAGLRLTDLPQAIGVVGVYEPVNLRLMASLRGRITLLVALATPEVPDLLERLDPERAVVFGDDVDLSENRDLVFAGELQAEAFGSPLVQTVPLSVTSKRPIEAVPLPSFGPEVPGSQDWRDAPHLARVATLGEPVDALDTGTRSNLQRAQRGVLPLPLSPTAPGLLPAAPFKIGPHQGALAVAGTSTRLLSAADVWHGLLEYPEGFDVPAWPDLLAEPAPRLVAALLRHLFSPPSPASAGDSAALG